MDNPSKEADELFEYVENNKLDKDNIIWGRKSLINMLQKYGMIKVNVEDGKYLELWYLDCMTIKRLEFIL